MKKALFILLIFAVQLTEAQKMNNTIYSYKVNSIDGEKFDLSSLKGKKVLIVNTASKCGYTPQYEDLEKLYEKYKASNFTIIGFPANNFGAQEPGTNEEIMEFCKRNYGVSFPMMEKISVKGEDMHPLYHFLTEKKLNGVKDSQVKWNFQKYLINADGTLADVLGSEVKPFDEKIVSWIEKK
jgi:glutathione peroxidase